METRLELVPPTRTGDRVVYRKVAKRHRKDDMEQLGAENLQLTQELEAAREELKRVKSLNELSCAIQLTRDLEAAREELKEVKSREVTISCVICLEQVCSPLSACSNGHFLCAPCLYGLVNCTWKVKVLVDPTGVPRTEISCPPYSCPSCKEKSELADILTRPLIPAVLLPLVNSCECPHCKMKVGPRDGQHVFTCPDKKVICPQCSQHVAMSLFDHHIAEQCNSFTCPQCFGAHFKFTAKELQRHLEGHPMTRLMAHDLRRGIDIMRRNIDDLLSLNEEQFFRGIEQSEYTGTFFF